MTGPKRIQLSRRKGWRKPDGAIVVARPSKWGNPHTPMYEVGTGIWRITVRSPSGTFLLPGEYTTRLGAFEQAVECYRNLIVSNAEDQHGDLDDPVGHMLAELRGHDLCCWCKPGQPCHADVLLELANPTTAPKDRS